MHVQGLVACSMALCTFVAGHVNQRGILFVCVLEDRPARWATTSAGQQYVGIRSGIPRDSGKNRNRGTATS